jgi:GAF domain-containing protein
MQRTSSLGEPERDRHMHDTVRRVARLVAEEFDAQHVFDVVVEALGEMVGAGAAWLVHFDSHGFITNLGVWSTRELSYPIGTRQDLSDEMRAMRDGRRPFRVDVTRIDPDSAFAGEAQRLGIESAVGVPVLLGGQVWALAVVARFGGTTSSTATPRRG